MSNIDETAKTLILNSIQNVFTESAIEEPIVEETPAEKLRREVAEKIAHDLQERKEATKMYKSGDATTSDEKESTIKAKNGKNKFETKIVPKKNLKTNPAKTKNNQKQIE